MPRSASEGKAWTRDRVVTLQPESILDIGPGVGTYSDLLRPHLPDCRFECIEIFDSYVVRYNLHAKYHRVRVGDALDMDFTPSDVVILGDVLEHVPHDAALGMWEKARRAARVAVFLSLPVIEYPQGALEGNIHETHLHTWSDDSVRAELSGITDGETYTQVGVYQAKPL